jgi:hypothetical protein
MFGFVILEFSNQSAIAVFLNWSGGNDVGEIVAETSPSTRTSES